jgi:hypothetical protein
MRATPTSCPPCAPVASSLVAACPAGPPPPILSFTTWSARPDPPLLPLPFFSTLPQASHPAVTRRRALYQWLELTSLRRSSFFSAVQVSSRAYVATPPSRATSSSRPSAVPKLRLSSAHLSAAHPHKLRALQEALRKLLLGLIPVASCSYLRRAQ